MTDMDGLLIIDKPAGLTSHDVVTRVRRILHKRRVGHTGTLDPFATGVLVMLVGRATRLAQFLSGAEKEYDAVIRLGYATDSGDLTGERIPNALEHSAAQAIRSLSAAQIEAALQSLRGEIDQIPPMYSAKKSRGRRLHDLARRGETIERKPVRVTVHVFELARGDHGLINDNRDGTFDLAVRVVCSAGTYVRTLAESFGERLGVGAHLAKLRRTRAGGFLLQNALTLEQLKQHTDQASLATVLLPMKTALPSMPFVHLSADDSRRVRNGAAISLREAPAGNWADGEKIRICDQEGNLLAIGVYDQGRRLLRQHVVVAAEE